MRTSYVNVHSGIAYFWGLTIDPIVCMCVIVVIGLAVDYSVHIAHAFRDAKGRRTCYQNPY